MNPMMVERTPHPGPLPIGSADSADAEREKRSQRLDGIVRPMFHGFNARFFRGILLLLPRAKDFREKGIVVPAPGEFGRFELTLVWELNPRRLPSNLLPLADEYGTRSH
jgi:hypothetical protein